MRRVTSDMQLAGGAIKCADGSWRVECVFTGMDEQEAEFVSAWLERLVCVHMLEVSQNTVAIQRLPH